MGLDIEAAFNKADTDHSGFIGKFFCIVDKFILYELYMVSYTSLYLQTSILVTKVWKEHKKRNILVTSFRYW